jgi:hypothetical protein
VVSAEGEPKVGPVVLAIDEEPDAPHIFPQRPVDAQAVIVDGRSTDGMPDVARVSVSMRLGSETTSFGSGL